MAITVADTTPLIALSRLGLLGALGDLLGKIYITTGVMQEATLNKKLPGAIVISSALDSNIIEVSDKFDHTLAYSLQLDRGESEAIALALAYQCPLLIDEKKGRRIAAEKGLSIFGTGAILLLAKKRGVIDNVSSQLSKLDEMGIYLSDKVKSQILKKAGE